MIPPVEIDFVARGVSDIGRAFDTIERRIAQFEGQATRSARTGATERTRVVDQERQEKERVYKKLFDDVDRMETQRKRIARQTADDEIREAKRSAREQERLEEYKLRVRIRSSELASRTIVRDMEDEARKRRMFARDAGAGVAGRSFGRMAGVASMAAGAIGIGGGFLLADSVRSQLSAERQAALLVNSATIGGKAQLDDRGAPANVANVLARASTVSKAFGVDKAELIGGMQDYVAKSSDFTGGMKNIDFFAKLSKATGTRLQDITGAAGMLKAQNRDLKPEDIRQMLMDMVEQGKQGAVEIMDLAHLAGGLGSSRGYIAGDVATNQRKLLAMAQITRTESESPEEAATAVKDLFIEAAKKANKKDAPAWLKAQLNEHGQIKSVEGLLDASLTNTKGNLGALEGIYEARGVKAFARLAPIFNNAGGGEAGIRAVHGELDPILNAHGTEGGVDQQLKTVMDQPAERFAVQLNRVKETLEVGLEPALKHLADKLPEMMPVFDHIVEKGTALAQWFADDPLKAAAELMLVKIGADITAAGIGKGINRMLETAIGGKIGGGLAIATASFAIAQAGMIAIDELADQDIRIQKARISETNEAANEAGKLFSDVRTGNLAPADLKKAQGLVADLEAKRAEQAEAAQGNGWSPISGFLGAEDRVKNANAELKNTETALQLLNKAIGTFMTALEKHSVTASNVKPAQVVPINERPSH